MANQFVYTKIPEHLLYLVQACDPNGTPAEDCAVFRWVDASEAKPPAGKLLDIVYIFDEAFTNSDSSLNVERLLALLRFCFNSALELTRSLSDGHVCKLRCNNGQLVQIAYGVFADELEKTGQYLIKRYGSWIEVWNMAGSTSTLSSPS